VATNCNGSWKDEGSFEKSYILPDYFYTCLEEYLNNDGKNQKDNLLWNKEKFDETDAKLIGFKESFKIINVNSAAIEGV